MLYTSYFANLKKIRNPDTVCVSIARNHPPYFKGLCYKKIAPTQQILNDWHRFADKERFIRDYKEQVLSRLNPKDVVLDLIKLTSNRCDNIVLLCYEKPEDFCHRHLVAKWLTENHFPCKEL